MKKVYILITVFLVAIVLMIVGYNKFYSYPMVEGDILKINEYTYSYHDVSGSHICNGLTEYLTFFVEDAEITIISRDVREYPQEPFGRLPNPSKCNSTVSVMNLHNPEIENPINCIRIDESHLGTKWADLECKSKIEMRILDMDKFNNCLENVECNLFYGADIIVI